MSQLNYTRSSENIKYFQKDEENEAASRLKADIPAELQDLPKWVCWRTADRSGNGKPAKIPVDPKTGHPASVSDPKTWADFDRALNHYLAHKDNVISGLGFVLSEDDPFTCIDLDNCRNPERVEISAEAKQIRLDFNSYCEISPRGRGLHIWVKGQLPPGSRNRKGNIELYDRNRFMTVTGDYLVQLPIESRQAELDNLHARLFHSTGGVMGSPMAKGRVDEEIIREIESSGSPKLLNLWKGKWQPDYPSQSEADLALCNIIASMTRDEKQIDRLFRLSGLYRHKWDEPRGSSTYGLETIAKALSSTLTSTFSGGRTGLPTLANPRSAADLEANPLPPPTWIIPDLLPAGLTILAGRPKAGKSWLALELALVVSTGGEALGNIKVDQGKVLYLALEDTERRLQDRLATLSPTGGGFPPDLLFALTMKPLDRGGQTELEAFFSGNPGIRLLVIDTLGRIKPQTKNHSYEADVSVMAQLQSLTQQYSALAILLVHHVRKAGSADYVDQVSGTQGVAGTADTLWVLEKQKRGQENAVLHITGRDVEEQDLALSFNKGKWQSLGDAKIIAISGQRKEILDLLTNSGPLSAKVMADRLGKKLNNIKQLLLKMKIDGIV